MGGFTAWHGSKYDFDKFDLSLSGTGEGEKAYGWGIYCGTARETGEAYRVKFQHEGCKITYLYEILLPIEVNYLDYGIPLNNHPDAVKNIIYDIFSRIDFSNNNFSIAPPLKFWVAENRNMWPDFLGREIYTIFKEAIECGAIVSTGDPFIADKAASCYLAEHNIVGMKYLDKNSRSVNVGTHNFVIFDDNIPRIVNKISHRIND